LRKKVCCTASNANVLLAFATGRTVSTRGQVGKPAASRCAATSSNRKRRFQPAGSRSLTPGSIWKFNPNQFHSARTGTFNYRVATSPFLVYNLSQPNLGNALTTYVLKVHLNVVFPHTTSSSVSSISFAL